MDGQAAGQAAGASPMGIPGARAVDDGWATAALAHGSSENGNLSASVQDGLFGSSLRSGPRTSFEGYGSLGHGHGAWLSSSPHPNARGFSHRPPLYRSPSMQADPSGSGLSLAAHAEELDAAEAGAAPAELSQQASGDAAATPRFEAGGGRPLRWQMHAGGSEASELAEPLLGGSSLPAGTPRSTRKEEAASAAAAASDGAAAGVGSALPGAPVVIARDPAGGDRDPDIFKALVFGLINTVATVPALVAYAAIVFKAPIYTPYLDQLCKLFFLSSAVHQAVFCLLSTLPFAVGQVQDVGLIFLSAMATSIAGLCADQGLGPETALGTSLLTMSAATFFVGAMTLLVARYKLAQLVQFLPLPVIGGYLSFVGYFCVASGIGLGVSQDIGSIASWANLWNADALVKLVPTLASCAAMIATLEHFSHPLALPGVLAAINVAFHVIRLALGVSLEQAMDAGWAIRPAAGSQKFWELWDLYNIQDWSLSGIYFPAMGEQVVKVLGLALVVIFGSAMDIAAIQQDTPKKIDFDKEMTTVAAANMATSLAGCGFTGSYIFSQTVFTMRAGVYSRWNGVVVAAAEATMFALPFSVVQYCGNFFYGSLLLWFGIEISRDWLVLSYRKMTRTEYGLLLGTFGCIMQWGLEGGIAAGIVLSTLYFALAYAKSQVASLGIQSGARSACVRTVEQQAALDVLGGRLTTCRLNGVVFFGSANSIGNRLLEEAERLGSGAAGAAPPAKRAEAAEEALAASLERTGEEYVGVKHTQAVAALAVAPAYLALDLSHVQGLDATGARTMGVVHSDLAQHGVVMVVTGVSPAIRPLLVAHGVPLPAAPLTWPPEMAAPPAATLQPSMRGSLAGSPGSRAAATAGVAPAGSAASTGSLAAEQPWEEQHWVGEGEGEALSCLEFATLEQGLRYCEDQLLEVAVRYGLCQPPSAQMKLQDMLASHLAKLPLAGGLDGAAAAAALRRYVSVVSLAQGQVLWAVDDPATDVFLIEKGAVRVDEFTHADGPSSSASSGGSAADAAAMQRSVSGRRVLARSYELGPGCVAGSTDFYLSRPHGTRAVCRSAVARVLRISRSAMERMAAEAPQALNALQCAIMRCNTLDLSQAAAWGSSRA